MASLKLTITVNMTPETKVTQNRKNNLQSVKDCYAKERQRKLQELKAQAVATQQYLEQKDEKQKRRAANLKCQQIDRQQQVEKIKKLISPESEIVRETLKKRNSIALGFGSSTPRLLDLVDFVPISRSSSIKNVNLTSATLPRKNTPKKFATSASNNEPIFTPIAISSPIQCDKSNNYHHTKLSDSKMSLSDVSDTSAQPRSEKKSKLPIPLRGNSINSTMSTSDVFYKSVIMNATKKQRSTSISGMTTESKLPILTAMSTSMSEVSNKTSKICQTSETIKSSLRKRSTDNTASVARRHSTTDSTGMQRSISSSTDNTLSTSDIFYKSVIINATKKQRSTSISGMASESTLPLLTAMSTSMSEESNKKSKISQTNGTIKSTLRKRSTDNIAPVVRRHSTTNPTGKLRSINIYDIEKSSTGNIMSKSDIAQASSKQPSASVSGHPKSKLRRSSIESSSSNIGLNNKQAVTKTRRPSIDSISSVSSVDSKYQSILSNGSKAKKSLILSLDKNVMSTSLDRQKCRSKSISDAETIDKKPPTRVRSFSHKQTTVTPKELSQYNRSSLPSSPIHKNNKDLTFSMNQSLNKMSTKTLKQKENERTAKKIITEDEARAALAERRRLAREEAKRIAQIEYQRIEAVRIAELQRMVEEEERQRQFEAETLRLAIAQKKAEELRLLEAIRIAQQRQAEEIRRKQEEELAKRKRDESERKLREVAEKQKSEIAEKLLKEEKDREERRNRVLAIMSRTRKESPNKKDKIVSAI